MDHSVQLYLYKLLSFLKPLFLTPTKGRSFFFQVILVRGSKPKIVRVTV